MNMVGIPPVNMAALPHKLLSEKRKIIPEATAPPKWRTASVPLLWVSTSCNIEAPATRRGLRDRSGSPKRTLGWAQLRVSRDARHRHGL